MPLSVWWEFLRIRHHFADAAHFGQGQFGLPSDIAVNLPGGQQHRKYALAFAVDKLNLGNFVVGLIESSNSLGMSKRGNDIKNDDRIKEKMCSVRSYHHKILCKVFLFNAVAFFLEFPLESCYIGLEVESFEAPFQRTKLSIRSSDVVIRPHC